MLIVLIKRSSFVIKIVALLFLFFQQCAYSEYDSGKATIINAPEVKRMLDNKEATVVNALSNIEYRMYHIPGSINIPANSLKESNLLPANKSSSIVFYCHGYDCPYSEHAVKTAIEMGYTNIYWFKGGLAEWRQFNYPVQSDETLLGIKFNKLSPNKVYRFIENSDVQILDIRPDWWRESGYYDLLPIKGTDLSLSLMDLESNIEKLNKDKPIIITDFIMRQSMSAARLLISKGYKVTGVLKGGIRRWKDENLPLLEDYFLKNTNNDNG